DDKGRKDHGAVLDTDRTNELIITTCPHGGIGAAESGLDKELELHMQYQGYTVNRQWDGLLPRHLNAGFDVVAGSVFAAAKKTQMHPVHAVDDKRGRPIYLAVGNHQVSSNMDLFAVKPHAVTKFQPILCRGGLIKPGLFFAGLESP